MIKDSPIKLYIFFLVMTRPIQWALWALWQWSSMTILKKWPPTLPYYSILFSAFFFLLTLSISYNILLFIQSLSFFHTTCSGYFRWFLLMTSVTCSINILSLRDTLHTYHSILLYVQSTLPICSAFMAQISFPYTIALLTHATYIFPFNFNDTPFLVKIPDSSLNFPQP